MPCQKPRRFPRRLITVDPETKRPPPKRVADGGKENRRNKKNVEVPNWAHRPISLFFNQDALLRTSFAYLPNSFLRRVSIFDSNLQSRTRNCRRLPFQAASICANYLRSRN